MAASDARPLPRKNVAYRLYFSIYNTSGALVTGAAGLDSEYAIDGVAQGDCANEATEIGSMGLYYLDLSAGEMNGDNVSGSTKSSTSGAIPVTWTIYPEEAGDVRAAVTSIADNAITASAIASDAITAAKVASDAVAEIQSGMATASDLVTTVGAAQNAITSEINLLNNLSAAAVNAEVDAAIADAQLATAANLATVDTVVDAIKVKTDNLPASPASTTNITAGTITTVTNLTNAPTSGDFTTTMKSSITTAATAATPTAAAVTGSVGGNVVGSVASVVAGVTLANDSITSASVAASAVTEIQSGLATSGALATLASYVDTEVAAIKTVTDALPDAGALTTIASNVTAILADTGTDGVVVASGSKAGYSLAADQSGVTVGTVNALGTQAKADVNAQVVDTLNVDTYAEPTSTPSATASLVAKIGWLMKLARNKLTQSSTTQTLYADDGTTAQNTATVADDGDVFTKSEWS